MNFASFFHSTRPIARWLRNVRRGNDLQKKRWVVSLSGASIVVVFFLWIMYLNLSIPTFQRVEDENEKTKTENQEGIFKTFSRGFASLSNDFTIRLEGFKNGLGINLDSLKKTFESSNEFSLQNSEVFYTPPDIDQIPKTRLP